MQLVIAEKPSVAQSIAGVLGATERKDGYMEGNDYIVSWCVGHLIELAQPESYDEALQKWTYESLPIIPDTWQHEVKSDTKAQYKVLYQLMHDNRVDSVVCATDAGREGELIFRLTYNMAGCDKPMQRLWISSMEESAIKEGFSNLRPGSEYDHLYESALCRQEADWLVGINGTRLFTVLYGGKALKVGRVQTPTLAMLVDREAKIMNFKKEAYYVAHILGNGLEAVSEHISDKAEAEKIAGACTNGQAIVTAVVKEEKWIAPPKLYDLTTLQRDANRLFGFTAKQTLEYTQSLYEKKLVTYPRTDSQYLSDDMEGTARNVIEAIFNSLLFEQNIMFNPDVKKVLNSKKVTDHHAIIPTMEIIKQDLKAIPESEMKILSLCANRLLCATAKKHIYNSTKAELTCNGMVFKVSGKEIWENGWKDFDDFFKNSYKTSEDKKDSDDTKKLPELTEGMTITVEDTRVSEHFTQPPKHYTEDSLLSAMERAGSEDMDDDVERKGLGTPATRADIIEKLVKDGFVKREKKQMIPTEDGMKLITVLPDVVKSPKLTADWENELTQVSKGEVSAGQFMSGIKAMVSDLVKTYHSVSDEQKNMFGAGNTQEVFGVCPKCGGDVVKGKFGAYCKNKCGMNVSRALGVQLSDAQVKNLLAGKKILVKGLKGNYDAYLIPESIEDFSYTKDGKEIKGSQYKFKMEFPHRKGKQG
jgi:DNA topoisomerase-3